MDLGRLVPGCVKPTWSYLLGRDFAGAHTLQPRSLKGGHVPEGGLAVTK